MAIAARDFTTHVAGEQLSAYVDGELPPQERRHVAVHLQECATCRGTIQDYRRTGTLVRGVTTYAVPERLGRDLLRRLAGAGQHRGHAPA